MSDEIFLGGKTYVSSKRAAASTGYAQDYIGQLARSGAIDAQRVGGLWYVFPGSLEGYKRNTESFKPQQPPAAKSPAQELETIISFDGKDYISSSKAAKLTGYNPDYVGQLARGGKVLSRQIGNRWYIEREGLLAHKHQKDALLASVQAEAAGLVKPQQIFVPPKQEAKDHGPHLTYIRENGDLFPELQKAPTPSVYAPSLERAVPIRVVRAPAPAAPIALPQSRRIARQAARSRSSGKTMSRATKVVAALTVVIVLSYGLSSVRSGATYAALEKVQATAMPANEMAASVSMAFDAFTAFVESLVTNELFYSRK